MPRGTSDSVVVFDSNLQRVSVFTAEGVLAWNGRGQPKIRPFSAGGRLEYGRWHTREQDYLVSGTVGQLRRDTVRFVLLRESLRERSVVTLVRGLLSASFRGMMGGRAMVAAPLSPAPVHDH